MAFIPLTDLTIETANSYCDVTFADSYYSDRNNTTWAGFTTDEKESYLILASDYIENIYYGSFIGTAVSNLQSLQFPRLNYAGVTIDYTRVKKAVCELALRASSGELISDIGKQTIEETVDVITVKYDKSADAKTKYPIISSLLSPLLSNGNSGINVKVVRV